MNIPKLTEMVQKLSKGMSLTVKGDTIELQSTHVLTLEETHKLIDGFTGKKKTGQIAVNTFKGGITTVGVRKIIKL